MGYSLWSLERVDTTERLSTHGAPATSPAVRLRAALSLREWQVSTAEAGRKYHAASGWSFRYW